MRWLRRHSTKTISVKVSTLESELEFSIPFKCTGKDLFDLVCGTFGLRETWYFGLQSYVLVSDGTIKYLNWLKPDKFCYFFHAKFYPEDVEHELIQPITKHLFYLEVKEKIENRGRLSHHSDAAFVQPSLEAAIQLTVLAVQIEFDDFGDNEVDDESEQLALSKRLLRLLPKYMSVNIQVNTEIAQRLKECYVNNKGLTKEEAEMRYLKIAQSYRLFGVDYFVVTCVRMKNPRTLSLTRYFSRAEFSHWRMLDRNQELSWVGITAAGIQLFTKDHVDRARYTFPWNIIKNVSYREHKFTVKLNIAWRPTKRAIGVTSSGSRLSSLQAHHPVHSAGGVGATAVISEPRTPTTTRDSPSLPGTPVPSKRGPSRPPLPPPPQSSGAFALTYTTGVTSKHLSATSHPPRGHITRARSGERPLPSPGDPTESVPQTRESTTSCGGGSGSGVHPHRSPLSASPASDFASGAGGLFSGSGVSSTGSATSGPLPTSRQGATIIEMWLAEPYQAKNIILLCAGNHSLFMRRRQPDSIDVQQMKAHEREERLRRETERARLLRERSEKAAALKLNAALESRCAELESALRSSTAVVAAVAVADPASPSFPGEAVISTRKPSLKQRGVLKPENFEEREDSKSRECQKEEENVEVVKEEEAGPRSGTEVQFSSREAQNCPASSPGYAHLRHQRPQRYAVLEAKRGRAEAIEFIDPSRGSPQALPTGIYEGFVMGQPASEPPIPTQSEPAIPQTFAWSPTVISRAREDLTSLTYSRPPFLPPRPAMVTQSLEHLPSHQLLPNLSQRSRAPAPYPITSTLSLHSGCGGVNPFQTGPQVVPSLPSNYHRFVQQAQPAYPWANVHNAPAGGAHNGRLFNGFSYPGHLNLAGDESSRQNIGGATQALKTSPTLATARPNSRVFELGGASAAGIPLAESVPLESQSSSRRPLFSHLHQSAMWNSGFPLNAYSNPYANYPYPPSTSGPPMYYCPAFGYRGLNPVAYYDVNSVQSGFSQSVPCAPVSMPILNAGDEFYVTGGGETEELPGSSACYQPSWYTYYEPYWYWLRTASGFATSATASSTGFGPRPIGWASTAAPLPPPPLPPLPLPMPSSTDAQLNAMLSPCAGPTRRRLQQQKVSAAKHLQRQQQQQQLHCQQKNREAQNELGRQVFRGISLQDLPTRTRSGSENGLVVSHTREYSASRPSLVQVAAATSSITFQPSDVRPRCSSAGGDGDMRLDDQQPPGIFTSPPPPNLLANPTSAEEDEHIRLAYQQQIQLHRRMWEEWMWRASAAYSQHRMPARVANQRGPQHLTSCPPPGGAVGVCGGEVDNGPLRRMPPTPPPPPPPPSYPQYIAANTSPTSAPQHLTPLSAAPEVRDPSGPDGSSSVGYMGLDFHGVGATVPPSFGTLVEAQAPSASGDPFLHDARFLDSFRAVQHGHHSGSVDRLSAIARVNRSPIPGYITNGHLYANMTLVDGRLVPLMGRQTPAAADQPLRASLLPGETGPVETERTVVSRGAPTADAAIAASRVTPRQSRPPTRYHSSQTVWLTGTVGDAEASRQPSERTSPQCPSSKVEITKSVGFWDPP